MAASSIATRVGRVEPLVTKCFRNTYMHRPDPSVAAALSASPQMVVLFPWVGAKERYAHKFVDAWSRRGFYVLHVTTPVMDLVKPQTGTEVTACRVTEFMSENDQFNFIIHGLSVGGYLGQRVLMEARKDAATFNRISSQVYDSFTQVAGFESGVQHGVNPKYQSIVKAIIKLYVKCVDLSCLDATSDYFNYVPAPAPTLFMHSLADKIAQFEVIRPALHNQARGNPVSALLIPAEEEIGHVSLFRQMGEEAYMSVITRFLRKHKFSHLQPEVLLEENPNSEQAIVNIAWTKEVPPLNS